MDERLSDEKLEEIAEKAADRAIEKFWHNLGVDLQEAQDMRDLLSDMLFLRGLRQTWQKIQSWSLYVAVTAFVGGILALVWHSLGGSLRK